MDKKEREQFNNVRFILVLFVFAFMAFAVFHTGVVHGAPIDKAQLRDIICEMETRTYENPATIFNADGAVGVCQILLATAHQLGYRDIIEVLHDTHDIALRVLQDCSRHGWRTPFALAYCYHAGPRAKQTKHGFKRNPKTHTYALEASAMYLARTTPEKNRLALVIMEWNEG